MSWQRSFAREFGLYISLARLTASLVWCAVSLVAASTYRNSAPPERRATYRRPKAT